MDLKYIVYITVNLCNGKFYFGVHKTNPDIFDGYIGCGIYNRSSINPNIKGFHLAVKKYGYENFRRTTIQIFPDTEEGKLQAYKLEADLVNNTLLKSKNCYNICTGGCGGTDLDLLKPIYLFDLNGNFIKEYKCVREAAVLFKTDDIYTTIKAIRNNCLGISNSSFGFYWSYTKKYNYTNVIKKAVALYSQDGLYIRYYNSIAEAESTLKICNIDLAIRKKGLSGNYQWRYYTGDTSNINPLINIGNKNKVLPIIMYDKDWNIIQKYNCVLDCVKDNPELVTSQINRVLKGIIKTHKGYRFKYNENIDEEIV